VSSFNFWTFQQIADELNVTVQYIQRIREGKYPLRTLDATKIGGRWVVSEVEAKRFISEYKSPPYYTPQDIAEAIGMTRKYVLDALTGYGGRKAPRLAGEKRGDRWVISREEAERFIEEH
jgi:transcriptional regulator with XRE-family HTH domain